MFLQAQIKVRKDIFSHHPSYFDIPCVTFNLAEKMFCQGSSAAATKQIPNRSFSLRGLNFSRPHPKSKGFHGDHVERDALKKFLWNAFFFLLFIYICCVFILFITSDVCLHRCIKINKISALL